MGSRFVRFLLIASLAGLIAAIITWLLGATWTAIGGGPMSIHGWIAMALGIIGTLGLGWGLMALAFRSHRDGWDDQVDNRWDPGRDDKR